MAFIINKATRLLVILSIIPWTPVINTQDTFSIVAVDTVTGEVGSAGASCVDLFQFFPVFESDFLSDLVPGEGALNSQAFWDPDNQANALFQFQEGNTPQEIINWLINNDISNNPSLRQYGIIRMTNGSIEGAAHTGSNAPFPKGQVIEEDYVVVANFMGSESMSDSMAIAFEKTKSHLACRLMAALQAAKRQGGDNRCSPLGISSLFSFVKTTSTDAQIEEPTFRLSVKTRQGDNVDAVDSLQVLFDENLECDIVSSIESIKQEQLIEVLPTVTNSLVYVKFDKSSKKLPIFCC